MSADPRLRGRQQQQPAPPPPPPPPADPQPMTMDGASDAHAKQNMVPDDSFKLKFCTVSRFNDTTYRAIHEELSEQNAALYTHNGLLNMLGRNLNIKGYPERFQDWVPGKPRLDHAEDKGSQGTESGVVDVVITCEERCFDAVLEDLHNKGGKLNRPVHVFNVDIKDNHEEALVGGKAILDLALTLNEAAAKERDIHGESGWQSGGGAARSGFDERVPELLAAWQERWPNMPALWSLAWV
ncbi:RNA polymerase II protein [Pyrenophora teres f. maculata]|nr:RNA polymerase II protein [Pyrenophora teres f. maculata]